MKNSVEKINLLVDAHVFDGMYQGTRSLLKGLYMAMDKMDLPINIYLAAHDIENLKKEFAGSKNIHYITLKSSSKYIRLIYEFPKLIKKYNIDFAHFQYIVPPIKLCKYIVSLNDILFEEFPEEFPLLYRIKNHTLFKYSAYKSDIVHTISEYSKNAIINHYSISSKKLITLPVGIEEKYFATFDKTVTKDKIFTKYGFRNYILYVSRIEPRKNHDTLLQAYVTSQLWNNDIYLVLIGKNDIHNNIYNDLFNGLDESIKQYIKHYENIPEDELIEFLKGMELFVFPSKAEGFGIPPIEAAALSVNTLCSNKTSLEEFEFFGDNFFDPYDVDELTKKISANINLDSKQEKERLENISHTIRNKYNWERIAKEFANSIINYNEKE